MPRYVITEKAGRFVAGHTNTGAGTILSLTKKAAEHEVRLGTLLPIEEPGSDLPSEPVVIEAVASSSSVRSVAADVVSPEPPSEPKPDEDKAPVRRRKKG